MTVGDLRRANEPCALQRQSAPRTSDVAPSIVCDDFELRLVKKPDGGRGDIVCLLVDGTQSGQTTVAAAGSMETAVWIMSVVRLAIAKGEISTSKEDIFRKKKEVLDAILAEVAGSTGDEDDADDDGKFVEEEEEESESGMDGVPCSEEEREVD